MFTTDAEREPASNLYKWSTGTIIEDSDPNWRKPNNLESKVSTEEYSEQSLLYCSGIERYCFIMAWPKGG